MKQLKLILAAIPAAFGRLFALFGFFAFFAPCAAKGGGGNFNFRRAFGAVCLSVILGIGNAAFAAAGRNATGERNATTGERIDIASHNKYRNWSKAQLNTRDPHGWTPMHRAVVKDNRRAVEQIIGRGADIGITTGKTGETALHLAGRYGRADIANVLIKAGANIGAKDNNGRTALHHAAQLGHADAANVLIKAGAHIEARDRENKTPLHWAMQRGKVKLVRILVAAGARKEPKDNDGRSPLRLSVEVGTKNISPELVEALGKADNAFVSAKTINGEVPLHVAAIENKARRAFALVTAGADIDEPDVHGMRALHYAARSGSIETLHVLIKAGANLYVKSTIPREKLPADSAKKHRKHKAREILREAGLKECREKNAPFWDPFAFTCAARWW